MEDSMEKLDILLWAVSGGFTLNFVLLAIVWKSLNNRIDRLENRIERLDEKVTDIDRRLCRLEGAFSSFSSRETCAIRTDSQMKKAE